jgi:hypothetical protein
MKGLIIMKKFYISNKKNLSKEEERSGNVSYKRIIDAYINNLILCNNITEIDNSIWDNMGEFDDDDLEIYQYYLCNLSSYERETLKEYGILLSYSDMLDLDVLCVEHFGTSWDSVLTDVEWTENFDLIEVEE